MGGNNGTARRNGRPANRAARRRVQPSSSDGPGRLWSRLRCTSQQRHTPPPTPPFPVCPVTQWARQGQKRQSVLHGSPKTLPHHTLHPLHPTEEMIYMARPPPSASSLASRALTRGGNDTVKERERERVCVCVRERERGGEMDGCLKYLFRSLKGTNQLIFGERTLLFVSV